MTPSWTSAGGVGPLRRHVADGERALPGSPIRELPTLTATAIPGLRFRSSMGQRDCGAGAVAIRPVFGSVPRTGIQCKPHLNAFLAMRGQVSIHSGTPSIGIPGVRMNPVEPWSRRPGRAGRAGSAQRARVDYPIRARTQRGVAIPAVRAERACLDEKKLDLGERMEKRQAIELTPSVFNRVVQGYAGIGDVHRAGHRILGDSGASFFVK